MELKIEIIDEILLRILENENTLKYDIFITKL